MVYIGGRLLYRKYWLININFKRSQWESVFTWFRSCCRDLIYKKDFIININWNTWLFLMYNTNDLQFSYCNWYYEKCILLLYRYRRYPSLETWLQVPSLVALVSQMHQQAPSVHFDLPKSFVPKINIEDESWHLLAHSPTVENLSIAVSDPSHSFFSATIAIPIWKKQPQYPCLNFNVDC